MTHTKISIFTSIACLLLVVGTSCSSDYTEYEGPNHIMFSTERYDLGVIDSEEWFEIPVSAMRPTDKEQRVGVEIITDKTSAIEGLHFDIEQSTIAIPAGKLRTAVRVKGYPENIDITEDLVITLRLVIDKELEWNGGAMETEIHLRKCCPTSTDMFTGYCKVTSTWIMQYMNADARLVRTELDPENENSIIVRDLFYEGYDLGITLNTEDRLSPTVEIEETVIGSTGEAFGTIYGNGKLMMSSAMGYTSIFSSCERYMMLYSTIYVEEVGTVGTYVHIFEWISDAEAERIINEGF